MRSAWLLALLSGKVKSFMPPERFPPDDAREWLNRAKSNLAQSKISAGNPEVYLEDLCFNAQQAAEKALKAVLIRREVFFPRTHSIAVLLSLVEHGISSVPPHVKNSVILSEYAVESRYPGVSESVSQAEYEEAVNLAEQVVAWAQEIIEK
jgi:HEPN domain-containing protein